MKIFEKNKIENSKIPNFGTKIDRSRQIEIWSENQTRGTTSTQTVQRLQLNFGDFE